MRETAGSDRRRRSLPFPAWIAARTPRHAHEQPWTVSFHRCDPMGVLWHGHYLAACEDARHALGEAIGLGVRALAALGLYAPVVRSQVVHHAPVRAEDPLTVRVELYPCAQPRLYHRYRLRVGAITVAEAETEQVLTDRAFTLLLRVPTELATALGVDRDGR